jgi:hypothetical protein
VMYECKVCNYTTKFKNCINQHYLTQKCKNAIIASEASE